MPTTRIWLKSPERRSYSGLCFVPGKNSPETFYNLWRGFTVEPLDRPPTRDEQESLDAFLSHGLENVCDNDQELFKWLMGYLAHTIQKPWELPLVALVFKGDKGVGKNALVERVGYLLGSHFTVVSNRRYLTGNFNSHLENKVMLVLDEAYWSGDKAGEGVLKDLITGTYHQIERKGQEPYRMKNCLRVVILGNENWLAPASNKERRYAVFNVGEGKMQNKSFFKTMREQMEAGGYRLLLKYLQEYDLTGIDISEAPNTKGLVEQKLHSLPIFEQWWYESLRSGSIEESDLGSEWPLEANCTRFRDAFFRYAREHGKAAYLPNDKTIGKDLKKLCPTSGTSRKQTEGSRARFYTLPTLETAQKEWDAHHRSTTEWSEE